MRLAKTETLGTTKLEMHSVPECVPTLGDSVCKLQFKYVIGYSDPVNECFYYLNLLLSG